MKIALITLSKQGVYLVKQLAKSLPEADTFVCDSISHVDKATRFNSILDLTKNISSQYKGLVYVTACGIAVRAIAPNIRNKITDPAVVVVDVAGRFVISILSGHEGGANDLAVTVANILGAEPVISTTTETLKTIIVGIGCCRGSKSEIIIEAVKKALEQVNLRLDQVRFLASAEIKANEPGLIQASQQLGIPLRFISSEDIQTLKRTFTHSNFVKQKVGLPAVAEPVALLAGRRTSLILPRKIYNGVTIAIAKESCLWLE